MNEIKAGDYVKRIDGVTVVYKVTDVYIEDDGETRYSVDLQHPEPCTVLEREDFELCDYQGSKLKDDDTNRKH